MNNKYGFIYITTNIKTGKRYIGMKKYTKGWELYLGSSKLLKEDIEVFGRENFKRDIVEECDDLKQLQEREIYFLEHYDVLNNIERFYNRSIPHIDFRLKRHTNCNKGKTWEEIYGTEGANKKREQLASRLKNKTWEQVYGSEKAAELKKKFSYNRTFETRQKMSDSRKGIKFSQEHKDNLRKARLRYIEEQGR